MKKLKIEKILLEEKILGLKKI